MSVFAAIQRQGARLRLAALVVALTVLAAHAAITLARLDSIDSRVAAVDVALAVLLLAGVSAHIRTLVRERQRLALSELLLDLGSEPGRIEDAAEAALARLVGDGLADAGLIAIAAEGESEARPLVASGYPAGWLATAPSMPLPDAADGARLERARSSHAWVDPLTRALGRRPWFATVPLLAGAEPIGVLLLTARRPGPLRDLDLLEMASRPLAALLHQSELYEAAYRRERDLEADAVRQRQFLAAIAHEVRTPLTSIRAFAELLGQADAPTAEESELLTSLQRGVERLSALINDLLELGQIDADPVRFNPQPLDVADTLRLAETVLRPSFMLREQSLRLEVPERPLYAVADRRHIEQVVLNLLSNANRHTPVGGQIAVRAREGEPDFVRIEVDDSGPGVDPADRRRVFEAYYRVNRPGAAQVPGSGLGLAVARRLTLLQGGKIWVEDAPGGGARFCVELRAAGAAPPSAVPPIPLAGAIEPGTAG